MKTFGLIGGMRRQSTVPCDRTVAERLGGLPPAPPRRCPTPPGCTRAAARAVLD